MKTLNNYLIDNQIKPNLTNSELLELKNLLEKEETSFIHNRSKECYLWEIKERLEK